MRVLHSAPVVFSALLPLYSASISVSTYCDPLTMQTDTGTSSTCSGSAPDGSLHGTNYVSVAQAQASASFTLLPDGFTFSASAHGESYSQNPELQPSDVDANATATITDTIGTPGPVRAGFIEYSCSYICWGNTNGGAGSGSALVTVGSVGCGVSDDQFYCPLGYEEPFTLGEPFQFGVTVKADGPGCSLCDTGDGSAALTGVTVTFYEADGVTPVSILDADPPVATPEPGTSLLITIGLLTLFTRILFATRSVESSSFATRSVKRSSQVAAAFGHINIRPFASPL
jgi:hypothetical protein